MRERRIWNFSTNDVASLTIQQQDRVRQIVRNGPQDWSLAPRLPGGHQRAGGGRGGAGVLPVDGGRLACARRRNRTRYGFTDKDQRITLELKNGDKASVEFSALASPNSPYAAVTIDGQLWIFQFSTWLYDYVQRYLSVPLKP